jgi:predicted SAM-dependent methyltransferase
VIEHLSSDELKDAIEETYRILKPNGKVFVRVFHIDDMRSDTGERLDVRTVVRGNGIMYTYYDEAELKNAFTGFIERSMERINETTKFKEIRSRMEAVFEKPA